MWFEEPGEFQREFTLDGRDIRLRVSGREFDEFDRDDDADDPLTGLIFAETAPQVAWASAIAAGAHALLDEHGLRGYNKLWDRHRSPPLNSTISSDTSRVNALSRNPAGGPQIGVLRTVRVVP